MVTPDTSGWNVITTSQISSDGKAQCNTTLASTDGVKEIHGGKSTFSGKNEQIESHRHDGDDKNYTNTSGHVSNTVLEEHAVTGDKNNGGTETTSNTTSSSSKTVTSSKYRSDNLPNDDFVQEFEGVLSSARRSVRENTNNEESERIPCQKFEKEYFNSETTNKTSASSHQQSSYDIRRNSGSSATSSVDAKKMVQRETEYLTNAPGQIISKSVEYPDANTKVITETKTLPDGSTVTTTKYESRAGSSTTTSKSSKQEKSATSRIITEDRCELNHIEIIAEDNKNLIDEVVKSKRMLDAEDIKSVKTLRKDDTQTEFVEKNFTLLDTDNENQEKIRREEIRVQKQQPIQEVATVPQIQPNASGIFNKQSTDEHKTVKKDLGEDIAKARAYETDLSYENLDRKPVQEEVIVPKKQIYHICSPDHDHSSKSDNTNKRISVGHNPTHEAFARSLRSDTPQVGKRTYSVRTNYMYTDCDRRSPSRDTDMSETSKCSSTTVTKSHSPNRKSSSPDKRKPTISNETINISSEQLKHSKKTDSSVRKNSQTYVSSKNITKLEDHYDQPRDNQPVYDIPSNNTPIHINEKSNSKNMTGQPSYSRPTASSTRHNNKPEHDDGVSKKQTKVNDEPLYETIGDRSSKTDSKTTFTTSVTRETKDYKNKDKSCLKKQPSIQQPDYERNFGSRRSNSPTSSVSDIEYVNFSNRKVTDLDENEIINNVYESTNNQDTQDGSFLSTHKKKVLTSSVESDIHTIIEHDYQGKEPFYLIENQKKVEGTQRDKPPLIRSETYEERCR